MTPKANTTAIYATISLLVASAFAPLTTSNALAASVASQEKALAQSEADRVALQGDSVNAFALQPARINASQRVYHKCLDTHISKTYGSC